VALYRSAGHGAEFDNISENVVVALKSGPVENWTNRTGGYSPGTALHSIRLMRGWKVNPGQGTVEVDLSAF